MCTGDVGNVPQNEARFTSLPISSSAWENLNVKHTSVDGTRTDHSTAFGKKTVGIQSPEHPYKKVTLNEPVQHFDATALLDQCKELGADFSEHCKIMWARHYAVLL